MLTAKKVIDKTAYKQFLRNFTKELKLSKEASVNFAKVYGNEISKRMICSFGMRKKEIIAVTAVVTASVVAATTVVGFNFEQRKLFAESNDVVASQILGNENTIATNTLTRKPVKPVEEETESVEMARRDSDIITPSHVAYTMENRELLAQMMFAEEGVFFSWSAGDPDTIERVHKLAGSVILHRLNMHFSGAQTLADVLYAPGQYDSRTIARVEQGQALPAQVYQWADELLTEGTLGPDNLVFQAEFPQGSAVYDHIGNQYFCVR